MMASPGNFETLGAIGDVGGVEFWGRSFFRNAPVPAFSLYCCPRQMPQYKRERSKHRPIRFVNFKVTV